MVGLDLERAVFPGHREDEDERAVLRKTLRRAQVAEFFSQLPGCVLGMDACGFAHHWARKLREVGHEVGLIAPQDVTPYVNTNKTDAANLAELCIVPPTGMEKRSRVRESMIDHVRPAKPGACEEQTSSTLGYDDESTPLHINFS